MFARRLPSAIDRDTQRRFQIRHGAMSLLKQRQYSLPRILVFGAVRLDVVLVAIFLENVGEDYALVGIGDVIEGHGASS